MLCFRGQTSAGVRTKPPQLPLCMGLMIDRCATFYLICTPLTCCIMTLSLSLDHYGPFTLVIDQPDVIFEVHPHSQPVKL